MTPPRPPLALIAAVSRDGVIGKNGKVPWDLPEDRAHFRRSTMGHAVIMGRKTWDETGRPLEGRRNLVVTRAGVVSGRDDEREVVASLEDAIARARTTDAAPFVIGGAEIFRLALPLATRLVLTELTFDADGDTSFPPFDRAAWRVTERRAGDRAFYVTYERA
ncbi:MAG TPA: dihydrofolate reductase [Polyangia bacterium]|jgi:dihydrofolate reductase|nr:dihydrofolate reductase [Polyangia bacterium]